MKVPSNRRALTAALGMFVSVGFILSAALYAAASQGWYTADQASHGHVSFNSYCAECHRPDLKGAMGPALVGDAFLKTWENKPLTDLYNFEHANMPATNPGIVPENKMWMITAYILQKNGYPAGQTPLSAQSANRTLTPPPH